MIEIKYDSSNTRDYKFKKSRDEEIIQNIENILSRIKGNVPLSREKGLEASLIDEPLDYVQVYMTGIVMDEIERDEPRFKVEEVLYDNSNQEIGKLIIKVKGAILDE
ncbi:hypothetical protein [Cetobacterium somerae]|uniref:hypothetical protein n=1 Tax=Cetobacterium somerae TaxID=188913 RepID=UPI0038924A56